jgi:hypothetical protein
MRQTHTWHAAAALKARAAKVGRAEFRLASAVAHRCVLRDDGQLSLV